MKRKVIQIADSTQLVSLPRKWCIEQGIKKGDELEVEEQGNKIQVSTSKEGALEKAQIHFSDASSFLSRPIRTLYKIGYDEVDVSFDDPSILELIQESTEEMLGFEIVHHSEGTCTIRNVASAMDTEFENVLRRLMLMLVSTGKDAAEVIAKRDFGLLDEIIKREKINDKLTLFCERILNKRGYKDHKKLTLVYYVVCQLEHLFDDLNAICLYTKEHKPKFSPVLTKMLRSSADLIEVVYNLFYKYDVAQVADFKKRYTSLDRQGEAALQNAQKHDAIVLHYLLELLDKLNHLTAYFPYANN